MKLSFKKTKKTQIISVILTLVFFGVIAFNGLLLYNLYNSLTATQPYQAINRIVRIDLQHLGMASIRYSNSLNYTVPVEDISNPFNNPTIPPKPANTTPTAPK